MKRFYSKNIFLLKTALLSLVLMVAFIFSFSCEKKNTGNVTTELPIQEPPVIQAPTVQTEPTPTVPEVATPTIGIQIGDIGPDLNLQDTLGTFIKLSSLRGKIVLLDFWASWCKPCKNQNKNLINVYKDYQDTSFKDSDGFEVYMVSVFEHKKEHWLWELRKQQYNWKYNVYDEGGAATWYYDIKGVPMNFLLDKNGIIVAKDLRDTLVDKALIKLLK